MGVWIGTLKRVILPTSHGQIVGVQLTPTDSCVTTKKVHYCKNSKGCLIVALVTCKATTK